MLLKVNKDAAGTDKLEDHEVTISSLNDFKFLNHSIVQHPSQHIRLNFSDPLQPEQDLSGLLDLSELINPEAPDEIILPDYQ